MLITAATKLPQVFSTVRTPSLQGYQVYSDGIKYSVGTEYTIPI